jgi:hypothetical protein
MRKVHKNGAGAQPRFNLPENAQMISSRAVQLIDESQSRNFIVIGLPPNSFALRLNPLDPGKDDYGAIQHPQASFNFGGEINMARRIDQIYLMVVPAKRRSGGGNRYAPLSFIVSEVHDGFTVVHLANFMGLPGVEKEPFRCCCFARIDMSYDPDISYSFNWY